MTEFEASNTLGSLLADLGVVRGETIFLAIDVARVPLPHWPVVLNQSSIRNRENRWCTFLFENIMEAIGPHGTLLVGTYSYSCGNPEIPFEIEKTPSEIGPFTNWVRQHPQSIRSLHPIFSVAGVGPNAANILTNNGGSAFGPCSPFGRLAQYRARFVNLGIPFRQSLTYVHHLEQCYGCDHRYHKTFSGSVFQNGKRVGREFLGYMRWRGIDAEVDVGPLEDALKQAGMLREVIRPGIFGQSARAIDVDNIGYQMLCKDSHVFCSPKIRVDIDDLMVAAAPGKDPITTFKLLL